MALYAGSGRRRAAPSDRLRPGRASVTSSATAARYDVVHTASFPYFSLLAAAAARSRSGFRIVVDWHEVWTRAYWREYLGPVAGWIGWQRSAPVPPRARSALSASRGCTSAAFSSEGVRGELTRLEGQYAGDVEPSPSCARADRSPSSRAATSRRSRSRRSYRRSPRRGEQIPDLRGEIYGDGPEREKVLQADRRARARRRASRHRGSWTRPVLDEALATRALPPPPVEARGLRPRRRRGRRARRAGRRRPRTRQRRHRARRGGRERHRRARRRRQTISQPRSSGSIGPVQRCASPPRTGSAATPSACRSSTRSRRCSRRMPPAERSVLHVLPHPGGGGETYVDLLERRCPAIASTASTSRRAQTPSPLAARTRRWSKSCGVAATHTISYMSTARSRAGCACRSSPLARPSSRCTASTSYAA